jgi:hypothetical protein
MFILLINFIYTDIVEYLTLNDRKDNLIYALLAKWALVLSSVGLIAFSVVTTFRQTDEPIKNTPTPSPTIDNASEIEKNIKNKHKLKSHGDRIIEEMKKNK